MNQEIIYKCPERCPVHKNCFIVKLEEPPEKPVIVLHKCPYSKQDIRIVIGERPP